MLPQKDVACRLLTDGAGATLAFALLRLDLGLLYLLQVKAAVLQEQVVLAGHHGLGQIVADTLQGHPVVIDLRRIAIDYRLDTAYEHQGRHIHGDILEDDHGQNGRGEKEDEYVAQPAGEGFHLSYPFLVV